MAFATGEGPKFKNGYPKVRDSKASGRIPRRSADFTEYILSLTKRIQENLLKDLHKRTKPESMLIL